MAAAEHNISQDFVSIMLSDNPGCDVLESFVSKLDDQLAENELQLESCLKDIAFCMSSNTSGNVSDVLPNVCKDTFLASNMCNNSDTSETMQLITGWIKLLESGDENELLVLQSMIHLSSMEGLVFPKCSVANASSLNCGADIATSASGNMEPSAAWNSLCLRIRNKVLNQLEQLPSIECPDKQTPQFGCHSNKRRQLISSLHLLFTSAQIAMLYRDLRQNQLQKLIDQQLHMLPSAGGLKRQASCDQSVERFVSFMSKVTGMMAEDFELLVSGGFEDIDLDSSFDCMSDIYFDRLQTEIETILDKFVRELQSHAEGSRKRGSKAEKADETPGEAGMNKSPSDIGFLGRHFSFTSRRNRSRSADNLIANGQLSNKAQQLPNVKFFESSSFDALLRLVECLVKAEDQLEAWQAVVLTSWHHVVDVGREATPSCQLKSAMKVPQCNVSASSKPEVKKTRRLLFGMKRDSLKSNAIHPLCTDSANDTGERGANETVPLIRDASLTEHGHFDWQRCFAKLTEDVAKQLSFAIRSTLQRTLHDDSEQFEKSGTVTSRLVVDDLATVDYESSKPVASSTWSVFHELRRMIWFAKAGKEPSLVTWRTAYVEELLNCLEHFADWLEKMCDASSSQHPVTGLYVALNTASFWLEKIRYFELEPILDESGKEELRKLSSRFQEISENMISYLTKWHSRQLATTVLCDSESHNWTKDAKEFCEGERCSYDIQVWNLYMNGLQSDLWSSCQLNDARQILSGVLKGALFHFMWRYTRVRPSRRRIPQFVGDITAILLCTSNLLYAVCKSLSTFIDPCEADGDLFSIHNYCSVLLATMAVVGAPLEVLYRVFRKGFNRKSSCEEVAKGSNVSQWLCWINPRLFPRANTSYEDLPVNSAIFIQLYLLKYQRDRCRYDLLLQSLLMKDHKLAVLLLTHLEEIVSKSASMSSAATAESVFIAIIDILGKCADFPAAIAYTVLPILERSNDWNIFDGNCIIGKSCQCPLWLVAVRNQLKPYLLGVVDEVCRDLLHSKCSQSLIAGSPVNLVHVDKLPCGCTFSSQSFVETDMSDDVSRSIRCVISRLAGNIHAVPQSVVVLLHHLHKSYVGRSASPLKSHQSVGLTVLATCLRLTLLDCDVIEAAFNCQLTSDNKRQLETLAENVHYVLTAVDTCDEVASKIPENVIKIMTSNRNWLLEQVDTINEHINNEMYSPCKQQSVDGNPWTDFTQTSLRLLAQSLCVTQAGIRFLDTVYQFVVVDNFDWIISKLGISDEVTCGTVCPKMAATSNERIPADDTSQPSLSNFNPLKEYNCIGPAKFDHVAILKFNHNWQSLLQCELGLSKVGFRSLLFHRHDMGEGAQIEDAERRLVEALLKKFDKDIDGTAV